MGQSSEGMYKGAKDKSMKGMTWEGARRSREIHGHTHGLPLQMPSYPCLELTLQRLLWLSLTP